MQKNWKNALLVLVKKIESKLFMSIISEIQGFLKEREKKYT